MLSNDFVWNLFKIFVLRAFSVYYFFGYDFDSALNMAIDVTLDYFEEHHLFNPSFEE